MRDQLIHLLNLKFLLLIALFTNTCFSSALADNLQPEPENNANQQSVRSETGIEIGALIFLGPDIRFYYRETDSPWAFGIRYLDIEDDFIYEPAVGFSNDESDKLFTKTVGIYADYLFNNSAGAASFYASGALYKTTKTLECFSETDSDSAISLYFGGGYQGAFSNQIGYKVGMLISPFVNFEQSVSGCSNEESSDFDLDVSLIFRF